MFIRHRRVADGVEVQTYVLPGNPIDVKASLGIIAMSEDKFPSLPYAAGSPTAPWLFEVDSVEAATEVAPVKSEPAPRPRSSSRPSRSSRGKTK